MLAACGGSGGSSVDPADTTPPAGYTISGLSAQINETNQASVSFVINNAELGATFSYSFSDSASGELSGTGSVLAMSQTVSGINLSGLADGAISLAVRLRDSAGNLGLPISAVSAKLTSQPVDTVRVSGRVSFARVPYQSDGIGLDYSQEREEPVREANYRVRNGAGDILLTGKTGSDGSYAFNYPVNSQFRLEILAHLEKTDASLGWYVRVVDNANANSLYVLQSSLLNSGASDFAVNLHAASGWTGSGYGETRAAAPFAILDSLYKIHQKLRAAGVELQLPQPDVHWSITNNNTSYFDLAGQFIEILGRENVDTDEYDEHVIVHEWRHYFENRVSRGDILGGSHSDANRLEIRTALSEGIGNGWAGYILDDPIYRDALGNRQGTGFKIDLESAPIGQPGWYRESSVQQIFYDLLDSENEGADQISLPLSTLMAVWQSDEYIQQASLTGIHAFKAALDAIAPAYSAGFEALLANQNVDGSGFFAAGETNNAGLSNVLPIYAQQTADAPVVVLCSDNTQGELNRVGNRQLVQINIGSAGNYQLRADRRSGILPSDPNFVVYLGGKRITSGGVGQSLEANREAAVLTLQPGIYVVDLHDFSNVDNDLSSGGNACFGFSVTSGF